MFTRREDLFIAADLSESALEQAIIQMYELLPGVQIIEGDLIIRVHPSIGEDALELVTHLESIYHKSPYIKIDTMRPRFKFYINIDSSLDKESWCLEHDAAPTKEGYDTIKLIIHSKSPYSNISPSKGQ